MEHSYIKNPFVRAFESLILDNPMPVIWAGDYAEPCKRLKTNIYSRSNDGLQVRPDRQVNEIESRFIINHTKKLFVDKYKVPNNDGWMIHPLPLLTSDGNGQGGGDYFSDSGAKFIGTWAKDTISVSSKKPKGFVEITPNFSENR